MFSRSEDWPEEKNGPSKEQGNYSDGPPAEAETLDTNWHQVVESFDDMNLKEELLRGIYAYGFEKPSAIQQRAIMPCIQGRDVIAQAQSGTGKTATFSISILQQIDTNIRECQALILAPTRELAQQIQKVCSGDLFVFSVWLTLQLVNLLTVWNKYSRWL